MAKKTDKEYEKPTQDNENIERETHFENSGQDDNNQSERLENPENTPTSEIHNVSPKQSWYKRSWHWLLTHKKLSIPLAVLVVLGVLAAVPFTRYLLPELLYVNRSPSPWLTPKRVNRFPVPPSGWRASRQQLIIRAVPILRRM